MMLTTIQGPWVEKHQCDCTSYTRNIFGGENFRLGFCLCTLGQPQLRITGVVAFLLRASDRHATLNFSRSSLHIGVTVLKIAT